MSKRGLVVWLAAAVALVMAPVAYLVFGRETPPNYSAAATARCLRSEGYDIRPYRFDGYPVLEIRRHRRVTTAAFFQSAAAAKADAGTGSIPSPTKRNVDIDQEGGDFPQFLTACLRS